MVCVKECTDLITKYFLYLDYGPRSEAPDLFTEDGRQGRVGQSHEGKEAIRAAFARLPETLSPIHLVTNIMITPQGPEKAVGMAYIVAYNLRADPSEPMPRKMPPTPSRIGKGDFEFRKTADGWRIAAFVPGTAKVDDGLT